MVSQVNGSNNYSNEEIVQTAERIAIAGKVVVAALAVLAILSLIFLPLGAALGSLVGLAAIGYLVYEVTMVAVNHKEVHKSSAKEIAQIFRTKDGKIDRYTENAPLIRWTWKFLAS